MGKMQRNKGRKGEIEFAHLCQDLGYKEAYRTAQHCGKAGHAGDVEGLPGIHIEVKRTEKLNLYEAMEQSIRDSVAANKGEIPIVAHRRNKKQWLVILNADDFFKLYGAYREHGKERTVQQ